MKKTATESVHNRQPIKADESDARHLNFNLPHSAVNHGADERVQFVSDCIVNDGFREFSACRNSKLENGIDDSKI